MPTGDSNNNSSSNDSLNSISDSNNDINSSSDNNGNDIHNNNTEGEIEPRIDSDVLDNKKKSKKSRRLFKRNKE